MSSREQFEIAIIGAGIVGLAAARALCLRGRTSLVVLEAEPGVARQQTGHNSGVIHAGLYYSPGSRKAEFAVEGRRALLEFCAQAGVSFEVCGKLVVAVCDAEVPALEELQRRGTANGLRGLEHLDGSGIRQREPHARGVAGLWVPETGIVDFAQVAVALARQVERSGAVVRTGCAVQSVRRANGEHRLLTTGDAVTARFLLNCGGLHADRVARRCGLSPELTIVPFRGEYFELVPERRSLIRNLIYPVPDPRFPFLGVHFTRRLDGRVEAGPNAVLALSRQGYRWRDIALRDVGEILFSPGFWRLAFRYRRTGAAEVWRSLSRTAFVRSLQRLVPELGPADVRRAGSGVRAQALDRRGRLLDDFEILEAPGALHVLNAPSPAATAALALGEYLADRLPER